MKKIFVILVSGLILTSCVDKLEFHYGDPEVVVTGDIETPFRAEGETRRISLSFQKQRFTGSTATEAWQTLSPSGVEIHSKNEQFGISNRTVSGDVLTFDLTARENMQEEPLAGEFEVNFTGEKAIFWQNLRQEPAKVLREYRIESEANPFRIPVEGGTLRLDITVECRKSINGKQQEWEYASLNGLAYHYNCTQAASHHTAVLRPRGTGHYSFYITADPYYLQPGTEDFDWVYTIYPYGASSIRLLHQEFIHPADPELGEKEEWLYPASNTTVHYGPILWY